ncbi:PASTA domain-containing protein [Ruminococcus albus]|uniref:PASTA domain-containing protein n=1 Tax=Ruminococcus albus TaxID=1264 RepID=A0A1H7P291_RUMAL|nr:PASTA domain-containing protein [Ruminococcus albus]SEL29736.1 PASTA domain-containing protein [Ruminococcus albus]
MKRENEELKIDLSVQDAELFEDTFAGFEENAEVTDAQKKRVLSSVMRKAGFEMNEIINEKRKNITASKTDDTEVRRGKIQVKRGGIIAACVAVLTVGVITAGMLHMNNINADIPKPASQPTSDVYATGDEDTDTTDDNAENIMPDVTEYEQKVAESTIRAAGFIPVIREKYDDVIPAGMVIGTEPAPGTELALDSGVTLFISKGKLGEPETVTVPNVVGMKEDEAMLLLKEAGLSVKNKDVLNSAEKGTVVEQSVEPDTTLNKYDEITISVSAGITEPVKLTIRTPLPGDLRGSYRIDLCDEDGTVKYTKSINADTLGEVKTFDFDLEGIGAEKFTIIITSDETDKSVIYGEYAVDFTNKTADMDQNLNTADLLALNPAE